uniref:Uncharacterized protein n=1 Tax=Meloidogyne enterolobii TaxID=390850 RepID=A0A6V7TXY6_MELEN|nr:unnamed protein product [Meloidogyne enterolobii]
MLGNPIQVAGLSREKINLIQRDHRLRAQLDELKRQHNNLDPAMRQGNEQTQLAIINLLQEIKNRLNHLGGDHTGQQNINVMEQHHGQPIHRMQHPNVLPAQNVVDHGVMPTDRILYQGHNEGIINPTDVFPQHLHRYYGFPPNVDPSEFSQNAHLQHGPQQRPHLFHFIEGADRDNEEDNQ